MKIVLAPDAFKDCLSAEAVCTALKTGILQAKPNAEVCCVPLADGGEGTADCFAAATGGKRIFLQVQNAYGAPKTAQYILSADRKTALVEMAQASGIQGIDKNCLHTKNASTYGTGELILHAVKKGAEHIIIGLGGSATTDGGMGALAALGAWFLEASGETLPPIGANMAKVAAIEVPNNPFFNGEIRFTYACDVQNPFYGDKGAAFVFARQKGATEAEIEELDSGLRNLAAQYQTVFYRDIVNLPSMGAAGGLCGGLYAAFGGTVQSGFEMLADLTDLEKKIAAADLVLTGEGRTDRQTVFGKLPARVAMHAAKYGVPCVLISGDISPDFDATAAGFSAVIPLESPEMTAAYSIAHAQELLEEAIFTYLKKAKISEIKSSVSTECVKF
ncbi:MAG: glycerate kinase [Candidatus Fimenecus sp.]